jgi:hypothetical protein
VSVTREGSRAVVQYVERRPPPGAVTAQVVTAPFHLVLLPFAAAAAEFRPLGKQP